MSVLASYHGAALMVVGMIALTACTQTARNGNGPSEFLEARIALLNYDMITVNASVLNPTEGMVTAYADCVAAKFATKRQNPFIRRVATSSSGLGDIVIEKTTYLLSPVAPGGEFVLNAPQIVDRCKAANVPTV